MLDRAPGGARRLFSSVTVTLGNFLSNFSADSTIKVKGLRRGDTETAEAEIKLPKVRAS